MFKELLPIGSVVFLKNGIKKVMIIGIMPTIDDDSEKTYDYIGVLYPEGFISNEINFLFNKEDICDVIFHGYENPEREEFINMLENAYNEISENE